MKLFFISLMLAWSTFWQTLPANLLLLRERVISNWENFLGFGPSPVEMSSPITTTSATTTDLQQLIDARVKSQLKGLVIPSAGGRGTPLGGLVVVPSSGDAATDAAIRARIESSFSDKVTVRFDQSGLTGVITPIFQQTPGDDYLFLITPFKQP